MPRFHHFFFQKLNLKSVVSLFLFAIVFFILEYISDMKFVCSCQRDFHQDGYVYFIGPPMILTWVVYVTEPFQARIFSCFRISKCNKIRCFFVELVITYLSVGALWIAFILFDGDWYVCLKTNLNSKQIGIPCKKTLTDEENKILAGYKTESLDSGLCVLVGLILIWSFIEVITAMCIRKRTWRKDCGSDMLLPPYYRKVYEGLLEEQVSGYLKEELKKIAAARAKAICEPHLSTIREDERPPNNGGDGDNHPSTSTGHGRPPNNGGDGDNSPSTSTGHGRPPNNGGDGDNSPSTSTGHGRPPNNGGDGDNSLSTTTRDGRPPNNGGDGDNRVNNTVLEAWQKISDWDFSFSSNKSHVGAERAAGNTLFKKCLIV